MTKTKQQQMYTTQEGQTKSALSQSSCHQVKLLTQFQFQVAAGLPAPSGIRTTLHTAKPVFFSLLFLFSSLFSCFLFVLFCFFPQIFCFFSTLLLRHCIVSGTRITNSCSHFNVNICDAEKIRWPLALKSDNENNCGICGYYRHSGCGLRFRLFLAATSTSDQ